MIMDWSILDTAQQIKDLGQLGLLILIVLALGWAYLKKDADLKVERISVQKERLEQTKELMVVIEKKTMQDVKLESVINGLKDLIMSKF